VFLGDERRGEAVERRGEERRKGERRKERKERKEINQTIQREIFRIAIHFLLQQN